MLREPYLQVYPVLAEKIYPRVVNGGDTSASRLQKTANARLKVLGVFLIECLVVYIIDVEKSLHITYRISVGTLYLQIVLVQHVVPHVIDMPRTLVVEIEETVFNPRLRRLSCCSNRQ